MYTIHHNLELGTYRITKVVNGLENSIALNKIYRRKLAGVMNSTLVDIVNKPWQIWVDRKSKRIRINKDYLSQTDADTLYLDFIHEMVHLWQIDEGKKVFDQSVSYVDKPTEIEAYKYTIEDAKQIGYNTMDIIDYLNVRWIDQEEHQRLVKAVLS
ncbi:MAG: hypothetical protein JSV76_05670 [Candidatus Bathyarchaeota archaeon]|nr:MAG: hypothetical protein JSV76_05670 [Candidatus Bathyarchaeota archaeon]